MASPLDQLALTITSQRDAPHRWLVCVDAVKVGWVILTDRDTYLTLPCDAEKLSMDQHSCPQEAMLSLVRRSLQA